MKVEKADGAVDLSSGGGDEAVFRSIELFVREHYPYAYELLGEGERRFVTNVYVSVLKELYGERWYRHVSSSSAKRVAGGWVIVAHVLLPWRVPLSCVHRVRMRKKTRFIAALHRLGLRIRDNERLLKSIDFLDLPEDVRERAKRIVSEKWSEESDKVGLVAAAVYVALFECGYVPRQWRIADYFGITAIRLRNVLKRHGWSGFAKKGRIPKALERAK